jgi:P-type Mg2+ transporter
MLNWLTTKQAEQLLKEHGTNEIWSNRKQSLFLKFLSYFKNPLVLILIISAILSGTTGEYKNAIIIMLVVFLSTILDFWQEYQSGKAIESITSRLESKVTVIRDGKEIEILTRYIVPGDIVRLSSGNILPADGVIIQSDDIFVNESALTGESFPVEKSASWDDKQKKLFWGTNILSGAGLYQITITGTETEYGKIAGKVSQEDQPTAFQNGTKAFWYMIMKAIVVVVFIILLINALNHKDFLQSIVFALAIAVGITPELLPMIMSITMAKWSIQMAKKWALVKKLNAIPDFWSMDILCTDKTGTLTEDRITLVKHLDVLWNEAEYVLDQAYINCFFETGIKNVMDSAVLAYKELVLDNIERIDEIPYDFFRKRSSIIYKKDNNYYLTMKGAPEKVFSICTEYKDWEKIKLLTPEILKQAQTNYDKLSSQWFRVIAIAHKNIEQQSNYEADTEQNMILVWLLAFFDPPKESSKSAIAAMKDYGINVKILTGDSALVTKKVCEDMDIEVTGIISGDDFDIATVSEVEFIKRITKANICARLSPSQKEYIIWLLRKQWLVVGYLGDGINDAPSLKAADIGISVSNAVDVAKQSADIVLVDKWLQQLLDGVIEWRKTFWNTMKYMMMGVSSNFGNMFSMIGAAIFLPFFPMLPAQILVNNLLYDFSQITIPSDSVDEEYSRKPKHRNMGFIRKFMLIFGPISSLFDFATFFMLYKVFNLTASQFQTGWFLESLATQIFVIYIIRTRKIPFLQSSPSKYLLMSTLGIVVIGSIIALSPLGWYIWFSPLPWIVLASIWAIIVSYLIIVEITKRIFYKTLSQQEDV